MIYTTDDPRTYDLTTASGALSAGAQTVAPLVAIAAGVLNFDEWWGIALAGTAGVVLLAWVGPAWIFWVRRNYAETLRAENVAMMITERIRLAEVALDRDKERTRALELLRQMDHAQIDYALELLRDDLFAIEGNRVTWFVNGVAIPVTFVLTWWEKYRERQSDNRNELVADSDYAAEQHRDQCRVWNGAINAALVKLGYVRQAGSQYTARWLYDDDESRWKALSLIGVHLALSFARGILEDDTDDS